VDAESCAEQGDWKISGLGLTIPLAGPDGKSSKWEFPTFDGRIPSYIQRSFDYMGAFILNFDLLEFDRNSSKHRSTHWMKFLYQPRTYTLWAH
jgi:hypothetical protein